MKDAPPKIGEPADQWPLTTTAMKHTDIECVAASFSESDLAKSANHNVETCRCDVCCAKAVCQCRVHRFGRILRLPRVARWIWQACGVDLADRIDLADRRACTLITVVAVAMRNAEQPFRTSKHHSNHYNNLAERIERKLGGKRLAKLQMDMLKDKAPGIQRLAKLQMEQGAQLAHILAEARDDPNWTNPRPYHEHAARNDVIREVSALQKRCSGSSSHELTADIVNALFLAPNQQTDAGAVESMMRSKLPKKRRSVKKS
jgi:hypothetical protein